MCGVVAAGASAVILQASANAGRATDAARGQAHVCLLPSHSLAKGMFPFIFLRLDVLQSLMGQAAPCHSHGDFLCSPQTVNLVWEKQTHGNIPQGSHGLLLPSFRPTHPPSAAASSQLGAIPQHKPTPGSSVDPLGMLMRMLMRQH